MEEPNLESIKIMGARVAVLPLVDTVTDWGFELPNHSNDPAIHHKQNECETLRGVVFALGPTVDPELGLNVGDEVMFFNHNRNKIDFDGQPIIIMPTDDLIAVLETEVE